MQPQAGGILPAPWRQAYLEDLSATEGAGAQGSGAAGPTPPAPPASASFLSEYWRAPERDRMHHVIVRTRTGMILLNAYPYAGGHLLVALGEGRPRLLDYDDAQRADLWRLTDAAADLCERALRPQGLNIGINQGRAAGAGVPGHVHVHIVPRWNGDVNFMSALGRVRVLSAALEAMAERYRSVWGAIGAAWSARLDPPAA